MAIAAGIAFPWGGTHAGIPAGFDRVTALDDRYPMGAADGNDGGATGGSATHSHTTQDHDHSVSSHTHAGGTTGAAVGSATRVSGANPLSAANHTHTIPTTGAQTASLADESPDTAAASSLPSSYEVIWIESDGSPDGIPDGGWVLWASDPAPDDWTPQSGPAGRYLKGAGTAQDAGGTVGGTHVHAGTAHDHDISNHTHTGGSTGTGGTTNATVGGAGPTATAAHTHAVTIAASANESSGGQTSGNSGSGSTDPPSYKLAVIENDTGGDALPPGAIGIWTDTIESIPAGWVLCDGENGTPDLRDRMIVGAAANLSDLGDTTLGGVHGHSSPSGHTHDAAHTHDITIAASAASANSASFTGTFATVTHTHTGGSTGSDGDTSGSTAEVINDVEALPPYTTVLFVQLQSFPQTATPDPLVIDLVIPPPTLVAGEKVIVPDPIEVEVATVAPTLLAGEVTVSPTPIEVEVPIITPHLIGSTITVDPAPVVVEVVSVAPTLASEYTAQPDPVHVEVVTVPPTLRSAYVAQPEPVEVEVAVTTPTLVHGEATVAPDPVAVEVATVPPTLRRLYTATPSPLAIDLVIPPPTVFIFGTAKPAPLVIEVPVITPTLEMGEKRIVVDPLSIDVAVIDPTVRLLYTVTPPPLEMEVAILAPTLIPGEVRYTPAPLVVEVAIPAPSVGLIYRVTPPPLVIGVAIPDPRLGNVVGLQPAPTVTPTAAMVEAALSGRRGTIDLRFRYTRRTRTNGFIDEIFGIHRPGTITLDNTRAVVRDLDVVFNRSQMPSDFDPRRDIIGVAVEVYVPDASQWVSMPVGLFTLDAEERRNRATSELLPAKGADLAMLLVRSQRTAAYTVPAGSNYVQAVRDIIARHGLAHSIPDAPISALHDYTWGPGVTDYQITRDLLFGINYYPLWADATGRLRSRPRIAPSLEPAAVTYQDTREPRLVSGDHDVVLATDRKHPNRAVVVLDDPRNADYGYVQRENADPIAPNSTAALAYGEQVGIDSSSVDDPTIISTLTPHGLSTGVQVLISGHMGSTPGLNGSHIVDVLSDTTFSIPIDVSVPGAGGTVQATTVQQEVWSGDSDPPTKAMPDLIRAAEIAEFELHWAALLAQATELPTFIDPRREAREFYRLDIDGVEDSQLYAALGWRMTLAPGQIMQHSLGRAAAVELLSPPKL